MGKKLNKTEALSVHCNGCVKVPVVSFEDGKEEQEQKMAEDGRYQPEVGEAGLFPIRSARQRRRLRAAISAGWVEI